MRKFWREDFIDSTLRHHDSQNIFRHDELPPFMLKLYAVLTDFCQTASSDSGEVWAEIDQIRGHYERLISVFYNRDFRNEFLAKYNGFQCPGSALHPDSNGSGQSDCPPEADRPESAGTDGSQG